MAISTVTKGEAPSQFMRRSGLQFWGKSTLVGLWIGLALPAAGQEQPFSPIDDEILHLTPVTRQMDYVSFQPSMGAFKTIQTQTDLFHFDNVLLPPASWTDNDPDSNAKSHLATANEIRHSVLPQVNPRGTISLLLHGNGETPLDSDEGQTEFRSNGPALRDAVNPDADLTASGSWVAFPAFLMLSRRLLRTRRRRENPIES